MTAKHFNCPHCGKLIRTVQERLTLNITKAQDDYLQGLNIAKTYQLAVLEFDGDMSKAMVVQQSMGNERVPIQSAAYLGEAVSQQLHDHAAAFGVAPRTMLRILLELYIQTHSTTFS